VASCRASCTRMFARIRPPANTGQTTCGPRDQNRLAPVKTSAASVAATPSVPVSSSRGNRSAVATPIRAVAAASSRSARRTSARRRSSSDGSPTGTADGPGGIAATWRSSPTSAPGACPSRTPSRWIAASRAASRLGTWAWVVASRVRAWATSTCVPRPASNRTRVSSTLSCWVWMFCCAIRSRCWAPRTSTRFRATSGEQDHEHVPPSLLGSIEGGGGRLDGAPDPPPDVELQARVQPELVIVVLDVHARPARGDVFAPVTTGRDRTRAPRARALAGPPRLTGWPAALGSVNSGAGEPTLATRCMIPEARRSSMLRRSTARTSGGMRALDCSRIVASRSSSVIEPSPSHDVPASTSSPPARGSGWGRRRHALPPECGGVPVPHPTGVCPAVGVQAHRDVELVAPVEDAAGEDQLHQCLVGKFGLELPSEVVRHGVGIPGDALRQLHLSFAISESAASSRGRVRTAVGSAGYPGGGRSCVVEPARHGSSPGGPRRGRNRSAQAMLSSGASIRFVGAISSPSERHDGYSGGCRNQNSSFRELMAKSRLSPVDETADDWGSRYGSCLLRSQYVASARCRATAPTAFGWPLRRAMRS
jgi:hypothetical protein